MNPQSEPVRLGALIIGAIGAILALLVAFGVDMSADQQTAILGVTAAIIALASAIGGSDRVLHTVQGWREVPHGAKVLL